MHALDDASVTVRRFSLRRLVKTEGGVAALRASGSEETVRRVVSGALRREVGFYSESKATSTEKELRDLALEVLEQYLDGEEPRAPGEQLRDGVVRRLAHLQLFHLRPGVGDADHAALARGIIEVYNKLQHESSQ